MQGIRMICIRLMNWKISMCTTKHKVSPAYNPTVANESAKHINAPSDVCRESEWFVFGRWNECRTCPREVAIYRQRQAWSNGWQAWSNDSQSAWKKHAIRVLLPDWSRWVERNKPLLSTGLCLKPVLKTFRTSFAIFWTQKRLKLGMVSSFYPYKMCAKVERVTTKTGCTSCTNWTISFEVCEGFRRKLISYKGISFF